jgi:hypothetical protein
MNFRQKAIGVVIALGLALIAIFGRGLYTPEPNPAYVTKNNDSYNPDHTNLISTNPASLKVDGEAIIVPTQTIEFTFDRPLKDRGEFKNSIEPSLDYEIQLSDDRRTAKIVPKTGFKLGETYNLHIKTDSKFEGDKTLDHQMDFHLNVIKYNGV